MRGSFYPLEQVAVVAAPCFHPSLYTMSVLMLGTRRRPLRLTIEKALKRNITVVLRLFISISSRIMISLKEREREIHIYI